MRRRVMAVVGVCLLVGCSGVNVKEREAALAGADVVLRVDAKGAGRKISETFIGLSFETRKLLPDEEGRYYFRADDLEMVGLFRSLGVKSLRIGGNTADRATVAIPTNGDLDNFYAFARAAGVKVIYNLRLKNVTDPGDDVRIVKHIMGKYADLTECFTLGNEPDFYFKEYGEYLGQYRKFSAAILAAVPGARFCGPSTAGHPEWAASMARDVGKPELAILSLHTYPGGNGQAAGDPEHARAHLLSPELDAGYQKFYDNFVPVAKERGLGYRLEECNSLYNGGAAAISNSYASAVWALDFMYWWAGHGAEGVNFHTGTNPDVRSHVPGGYDAFWIPAGGIQLHPLSYALKTFDVAGHGEMMGVEATGALAKEANFRAYAVKRLGEMDVVILNRAAAPALKDLRFAIDGSEWKEAEMMMLAAPGNDAAAVEGLTLGGAAIGGNGEWDGKWTAVRGTGGVFAVEAPATSVVIVRLRG